MIRLWSINRILQWSGFRIVVEFNGDDAPTRIGLQFFGWGDLGTWRGRFS